MSLWVSLASTGKQLPAAPGHETFEMSHWIVQRRCPPCMYALCQLLWQELEFCMFHIEGGHHLPVICRHLSAYTCLP